MHVHARLRCGFSTALVLAAVTAGTDILAATRTVGSGKQYPALAAALDAVEPGDVVEVYDDETYPAGQQMGVEFAPEHAGTAAAKVTVRGIRKADGTRPRLAGGIWTVQMNASHFVLEGFEVTGGQKTCVRHYADDVTVRDVVIHDCARNGLLGTDEDSGSLTLEYSEIYNTGAEVDGENLAHQIYMATDEDAYPDAVFRMQFCWVHDNHGGNNVKTRARRNEIYYNWIEGAEYYELELIGPDADAVTPIREDSDVVGNVLVKAASNPYYGVRLGGDSEGTETNGRYRFVNNTFVGAATTPGPIRIYLGIDSLEISNNVFTAVSGGAFTSLVKEDDVTWVGGTRRIAGSNNFILQNTGDVPSTLSGSVLGTDPGFTSNDPLDVRPKEGGAVVDTGSASPPAPEDPIPSPLTVPAFVPGQRAVPPLDGAAARTSAGLIDMGAFELGSGATPGDGGTPSSSGTSGTSGTAGSTGGTSGAAGSSGTSGAQGGASSGSAAAATDDSGGCRTTGSTDGATSLLGFAAAALLLVRRRFARETRA